MKVLSWILFCLSLLCIVGMIDLGIQWIADYKAIQALPGHSGVDYLGLMGYPVFFVAYSLLGNVFSPIGFGVCSGKFLKITFAILTFIHSIVFLFFTMMWLL